MQVLPIIVPPQGMSDADEGGEAEAAYTVCTIVVGGLLFVTTSVT